LRIRSRVTVPTYRHNPGGLAAVLGSARLAHRLLIGALLLAGATDPGAFARRMGPLVPLVLLANTLPLTSDELGAGRRTSWT
jgi:hypothetical protein